MKITIFSFSILLILVPVLASPTEKKVYIVYLGAHSGDKALHEIEETHRSYLQSVKESVENVESSLVYSYKHSFNGFAAHLTPQEASKLSEMEEVISVHPSHTYRQQTTRSWEWEYIGLMGNAQGQSQYETGVADLLSEAKQGKDVIIGVVDSGIWPESLSFNDYGMDPIPESWKGVCQTTEDFTHCNKKIIGARYFTQGFEKQYGPIDTNLNFLSPRDVHGHGTHTASIAAGRRVSNVSAVGGFAEGTASGGAPLSRLAIYKPCWSHPEIIDNFFCTAEDVIAAMETAIADGVDIISISLGYQDTATDFIGFGALNPSRDVLVIRAAGNFGPALGTIDNQLPWTLSVGAGSSDRAFLSTIVLGNGLQISGQSFSPRNLNVEMYPLVYPGDGQCLHNTIAPEMVQGKIAVCLSDEPRDEEKGVEVARAGGVGLILIDFEPKNGLKCKIHALPETYTDEGMKILEYIKSTNYPTATFSQGQTQLHQKSSPYIAGLSSRGPNTYDPNTLKPDITAPGVYILAAWSESTYVNYKHVKYNIYSGTSMACPHVTGAAALIKAIHPDWSSAAIRSALMTTTWITNNIGEPIKDEVGKIATPFDYGAGHFRPIKAADPGLVYDSSYSDYVNYLCSTGQQGLYNLRSCPTYNIPSPLNLNYPSISIPKLVNTVVIRRTLTNVAVGTRTYYFKVEPPPGVHVKASPRSLCFNRIGQKRSFTITVSSLNDPARKSEYGFGWYLWTDGHYVVRSPLVVYLP